MKPEDFPKHLFWDTTYENIDVQENARWIIHRVIERGDIPDWLRIKQFYGLEKIKSEILQMRHLMPKTLHYYSLYFDEPLENFRCYASMQNDPYYWGS